MLSLNVTRFPDAAVVAAVAERATVTTLSNLAEGRTLTEIALTMRNRAQPFLSNCLRVRPWCQRKWKARRPSPRWVRTAPAFPCSDRDSDRRDLYTVSFGARRRRAVLRKEGSRRIRVAEDGRPRDAGGMGDVRAQGSESIASTATRTRCLPRRRAVSSRASRVVPSEVSRVVSSAAWSAGL